MPDIYNRNPQVYPKPLTAVPPARSGLPLPKHKPPALSSNLLPAHLYDSHDDEPLSTPLEKKPTETLNESEAEAVAGSVQRCTGVSAMMMSGLRQLSCIDNLRLVSFPYSTNQHVKCGVVPSNQMRESTRVNEPQMSGRFVFRFPALKNGADVLGIEPKKMDGFTFPFPPDFRTLSSSALKSSRSDTFSPPTPKQLSPPPRRLAVDSSVPPRQLSVPAPTPRPFPTTAVPFRPNPTPASRPLAVSADPIPASVALPHPAPVSLARPDCFALLRPAPVPAARPPPASVAVGRPVPAPNANSQGRASAPGVAGAGSSLAGIERSGRVGDGKKVNEAPKVGSLSRTAMKKMRKAKALAGRQAESSVSYHQEEITKKRRAEDDQRPKQKKKRRKKSSVDLEPQVCPTQPSLCYIHRAAVASDSQSPPAQCSMQDAANSNPKSAQPKRARPQTAGTQSSGTQSSSSRNQAAEEATEFVNEPSVELFEVEAIRSMMIDQEDKNEYFFVKWEVSERFVHYFQCFYVATIHTRLSIKLGVFVSCVCRSRHVVLQGYGERDNTWEPAKNLQEFGSHEVRMKFARELFHAQLDISRKLDRNDKYVWSSNPGQKGNAELCHELVGFEILEKRRLFDRSEPFCITAAHWTRPSAPA